MNSGLSIFVCLIASTVQVVLILPILYVKSRFRARRMLLKCFLSTVFGADGVILVVFVKLTAVSRVTDLIPIIIDKSCVFYK